VLMLVLGLRLILSGLPEAAAREGEGVERLVFAQERVERRAAPGGPVVEFPFVFTNLATVPVVVRSVRTSCGCTVVRLPGLPWTVGAGQVGRFSVGFDPERRRGVLTKSVWLSTSLGVKSLRIRASLTLAPGEEDPAVVRERNLEVSLADRTALFRDGCAECHARPAEGLQGGELFEAVCAICHDAEPRSPLVPDLGGVLKPRERAYWVRWISEGGEGSVMPGFAAWRGGPLHGGQVESLADYLMERFGGARETGGAGPHATGVKP